MTLKAVYSKNLRKRYIASSGENSKYVDVVFISGFSAVTRQVLHFQRRLKPFGENADDVIIEVPCGITAIVADNNTYLGEVNKEGESLVLAKGGSGGSQENKFLAEKGEIYHIHLDLKLIADVALVGFVNS
jgi:hypothetical protein